MIAPPDGCRQDGGRPASAGDGTAPVNIRGGLFRLWIAVSAAWALGSGIAWYQTFAFEQTQIVNIDECGKNYPPVPASDKSTKALLDRVEAGVDAEKHRPNCVPDLETVSFADFLSMPEPDREALRQHFENAIRSETQDAVVIGAGVPVGLLAFGLIMGWIIRGFPEKQPR